MALKRYLVKASAAIPFAIFALSGASPSAWAEDDEAGASAIEEVIVTATRRGQALSKVPLAISAVGQDEIERMGYTNMDDYFRSLPSLSLIDGGGYQKHMIIRGVAIDPGPEEKAATGVYVDETLVSGNFANLDPRIFDMERIEVLRGPQGTLYGGGSIAGSVRYITNKPNASEFKTNVAADVYATKGADAAWSADAMVNIPLIEDTLAMRVSGFYHDASGIYQNELFDLDDQSSYEQSGGRVAVRWTPTDNLTVTGMYIKDETDQDGQARSHTRDWKNRKQTNMAPEILSADAEVLSLTATLDVGWATVTSVTSQLDIFTDYQQDRSFLIGAWGISDWDPLRLVVYGGRDDEQFSQEIRVVSAPDAFGRFDWIAGMYYADRTDGNVFQDCFAVDDDGFASINVNYADGGDRFAANDPDQGALNPFPEGHVDPFGDQGDISAGTYPECLYRQVGNTYKEELAFYGELNFRVTDRLTATVGYRRTDDSQSHDVTAQVAEAPPTTFSFTDVGDKYKEKHNNFMGNLSLEVNDNLTLFARAAEGFRLAAGALAPNLEPGCVTLAQEQLGGASPSAVSSDSLWSYEGGAKMLLADGRLAINAGYYRNSWKDILAGIIVSGPNCTWSQFLQNIASATGNGVEFDMTYIATDDLELGVSASYLKFTVDGDQPVLGANDGDRLPSHPDFTLNGYARYEFPVTNGWDGFVRGEISYTGKIVANFVADPTVARPDSGDYALANLRGGVMGDLWEVALYVNNLFDSRARAFQYEDWTGRLETFVLRPRTIGLTLRTKM